jgi:hypothetical protein
MASFTIQRTDGNDQTTTYTSDNMTSMNVDFQTPVPAFAVPLAPSTAAILIKTDGNLAYVTVNWKIRDSPTQVFTGDRPSGAPSLSTVTSPLSILDYWKKYFVAVRTDDAFTLTLGGSVVFNGIMVSSNFTVNAGSPVVWDASLRFVEGSVSGATMPDLAEVTLDGTTPIEQGTGNQIKFNNVATPYLGNNSAITGYDIKYREKGTVSFTSTTKSTSQVTAQTFTINVSDTDTYQVKIAPKVASGQTQQFSQLYDVTVS